jgi:flap endonuclease-1
MGVPFVVAPSEAEAQCAELTRGGCVLAVATTDTDALVFGAKKVVTNLFAGLQGEPVQELDLDVCLTGELLVENVRGDLKKKLA